jgi:hypothetical protein
VDDRSVSGAAEEHAAATKTTNIPGSKILRLAL